MEGEMLKGHLDMIALAALAPGPAHGYAVIEEIKRRSGGAFDLPEGTVYPVLHRLEQAGLLDGRWVTADSGRRRRVYALTRRGERVPGAGPFGGDRPGLRNCAGLLLPSHEKAHCVHPPPGLRGIVPRKECGRLV